ncbi:unnamed protein product [Bursaphelenchus xylophilus]|uniref:(pine wood nematode) hypothetical protein n=1 Tax=Bursaphelenchus xylophilus TaxID=6326 RepID=A0A1I7SLH6_BURXY|nr:unnamed protein product [Bursaphelenchus xylophilus]CAG9129601.1 unnamed protein product [Bursaphelenchus xylophilus]
MSMIKVFVQLIVLYTVAVMFVSARPFHDGLTSGSILMSGGGNLDGMYAFAPSSGYNSASYAPYYGNGFFG